MKALDLMFFDAGGGHRSAANALREVIEQQNRPWQVRLVNLQELLDPMDVFRRVTGVRLQDLYNGALKKGWTLGSPQLTRLMHWIIRIYHDKEVELLSGYWKNFAPDLLVSLVPNFNRALFQALRQASPRTPMVTVLTDMADYPPHFWIEPNQEQYFICGTEHAAAQARSMGHDDCHVFQTSGMILNPKFYTAGKVDRRTERLRLNLDPDLPTGLVLFGGQGSQVMYDITERLENAGLAVQLILLCGHNLKLADRLRARNGRIRVHIEGFTKDVPYFMQLADFFIGKPGPGSISEALLEGLPVIVESNIWTLPQERFNVEWVTEKQVGLKVSTFHDIVEAVRKLLEPATYARLRANATAQRNRAVFEIPDLLDKMMAQSEKPQVEVAT